MDAICAAIERSGVQPCSNALVIVYFVLGLFALTCAVQCASQCCCHHSRVQWLSIMSVTIAVGKVAVDVLFAIRLFQAQLFVAFGIMVGSMLLACLFNAFIMRLFYAKMATTLQNDAFQRWVKSHSKSCAAWTLCIASAVKLDVASLFTSQAGRIDLLSSPLDHRARNFLSSCAALSLLIESVVQLSVNVAAQFQLSEEQGVRVFPDVTQASLTLWYMLFTSCRILAGNISR